MDGIDRNAVVALESAYEYIAQNLQGNVPSQIRGQANDGSGVSNDEATRFSIRSWQAANDITVEDQRAALEISLGNKLIPLDVISQEVDIESLESVLKDPLEARSLISPLALLFEIKKKEAFSIDDILAAGSSGGTLKYLGQGQESIVFQDMERHRVIKLGRVDSVEWDFPLSNSGDDFRPYQLGASFGHNIDLHGIPDFAAIQSVNDFARAFKQEIEFIGFLGAMDFMVFEQPAYTSLLDEKGEPIKVTSDEIRGYMETRGWYPLSPPMVEFWFHPEQQMTATDAHAGNFIKIKNDIVPIDIKVEQHTAENAENLIQRYGIKIRPGKK